MVLRIFKKMLVVTQVQTKVIDFRTLVSARCRQKHTPRYIPRYNLRVWSPHIHSKLVRALDGYKMQRAT